jgi:uncharacterized protein (DUF433 family)
LVENPYFALTGVGMNEGVSEDFIETDPEKMGGTPVFRGTRVPIQNLFDYLEAGDSLEVFLDDFPTVPRDQVQGVLSTSEL